MRMIIFFAVVLAAVGFIIYQLSYFFLSISNPKSRYKGDKKFAKIELNALASAIIPFEPSEFELISYKFSETVKRRSFHLETFGLIETIYSEPLVAFYLFEYNDGRNLLLTKQSKDEYVFYNDNQKIVVEVNGKPKYFIDELGNMNDSSSNKLIATFIYNDALNHKEIILGSTHIGTIKMIDDSALENERVLTNVNVENNQYIEVNYCYSVLNVLNLI